MDQAASDYVLAVRVLHTGSIIMTHAVYINFALFFIVSSIRNGDIVSLLGGVFFLLA